MTLTRVKLPVDLQDFALPGRTIDPDARYTYDQLCEVMEETNHPHELWDGRLLLEPPATWCHQEIVGRFYVALLNHVQRRKIGKVIASPVAMVLSPHTFVEPDVALVLNENLHRIDKVIRGPADLVAEVVSPSGRRRDRVKKRDLYERHGVKEFWIIAPEAPGVDVLWLSARRGYETVGRFLPCDTARSRLLPDFRIGVARLLDGA
jgi:Uma2 family endonuclease